MQIPAYDLLWRVPKLSERLAAAFFLTPFGRPQEEAPPESEGRAVRLQGRRPVAARSYGSGPPVFLVHGWGGSSAQMNGFVDELVRRGYEAITIDLPAHGESAGKRTEVVECSEALLAAARRFGDPVGVIAHSFGAAATTLAVQRGLKVGALVFVAPLPSLEHGLHQFAIRARLPIAVMDRAARLIEQDLGLVRAQIDLPEIAPSMQVPLLCVHDETDRVTPLEATRRIVARWPGARLLVTSELGHRRVLRDPAVIGHAAAFLAQGHQERPSDLARVLAAELAAGCSHG